MDSSDGIYNPVPEKDIEEKKKVIRDHYWAKSEAMRELNEFIIKDLDEIQKLFTNAVKMIQKKDYKKACGQLR